MSSEDNERLLTEKLEKFSGILLQLKESYHLFTALVATEHSLLKNSDIDRLEDLVREKSALADQIVSATINVGRLSQNIDNLNNPKTLKLTEVLDLFESKVRNSQFRKEKWVNSLIDKIKDQIREIVELREVTQSQVEMNIHLTQRLLKHHRDNYSVWIDVASSSSGVYDSLGHRSQSMTRSTHQTKA